MNWLVMAFAAGAILAVQATVNSRLGRELGNPMLATLASFVVGTVCVLLYCLAARLSFPTAATLLKVPVWAWFGGLMGTCYVVTIIIATPKLGVGTVAGLAVSGQMLMAVCLDHFGLLGLERHPITPGRLLGMALLIAGVMLLKLF